MPILSIIVPVYNVEKYLERCIETILQQDFRDFELILVDDGSPDKCGMICDEYKKKDTRIRVIHKENGGLSSARNAGISISQGEYLAFVDSDDWITFDMYSYMIDLADKYNADIVSVSYCLANKFDKKKVRGIDYDGNVKIYNREEALFHYLSVGMNSRIADFSVWNKIYRKNLFRNITFPEGQLYEDMATNYRIIKKISRYVRSEKVCYFYFQGGTSIVKSGFKLSNHDDLMLVGNEIVQLSINENIEIQKLANEKRARTYFSSLSKIALYGYDESVLNQSKIEAELLKELKKNFKILLFSNMPLNRKIMMTFYCINFKFIKFIFLIYRKYRYNN